MARNRSELIQESLEDAIVTGEILPGTRLEEAEIANRFKTSRTPVREALHKLAARGLIEILPNKGAIVPQLDSQSVLEMFEVMAEYEAACARFSARRLTNEDRNQIQKALKACKEAATDKTTDEYYRANQAFHRVIYHATHNRYLERQCNALLGRLRPYRRLQLRIPNRVISSVSEHEELVNAIFEGRSDDAATIARDHVLIQGNGFYDFIALLKMQLDS